MKKLTILSTLTLLAAFLISCTKEATFSRTTPTSPPSQVVPSTIRIVGSWFSPSFNIMDDRTSIYLVAQKDHETTVTYDGGTHVELAYVKMNHQGSVTIKRLPTILSNPANPAISNAQCEINFGMTHAGCMVTIKNADRNISPSIILANPFPDMQVRYIVISKELFNSLHINWDDYAGVAVALNI